MKTEQISVPHFEGYRCIGYKIPKLGQYFCKEGVLVEANEYHCAERLTYEKISPKRYVFEETGEFRRLCIGDMYISNAGEAVIWRHNEPSFCSYKILRKVDE